MKKIFLPLILVFFAATAFSQKVLPIKEKSLIILFNSAESFTVASDNYATVKIYKISNPSGSAHIEGDDEVSHRFLIAVSTIDEAPEQYLYNVGDFYSPKILGLTKTGKGTFKLLIEYDAPKRKRIQLNIALKKISLIESKSN